MSIASEFPRVATSLAWLSELPDLMQREGFAEVEACDLLPNPAFGKLETDNFLLAEIQEKLAALASRISNSTGPFEMCVAMSPEVVW